jgi:hypothetical protein
MNGMDDIPILGHGEDQRLFKQFLATYDAPAYVRRARQVQEAFDQVIARGQRQRDEWLFMVRLRLGLFHGLAGDFATLAPCLANTEQVQILRDLIAMLKPRLRTSVQPTASARILKRSLCQFVGSVERFNRRWHAYLSTIDLRQVNALREAYNRYYLVEKECALRSIRLARQGYEPLAPLTVADVAAILPTLPVPLTS